MNTPTSVATDTDDLLSVRLSRVIPAPPEQVFEAWTSAELMRRWWGPRHVEAVSALADARPGGAFSIEMRDRDGAMHKMAGIFTELERPSLVCLEIRHRQFEGAAERPGGYIPTHVRVELSAHADGTLLNLTHSGFLDAALVQRFDAGWTGSLDKLHTVLADKRR
jgi:uncharacterized protein YndB with AHSA1/START domain